MGLQSIMNGLRPSNVRRERSAGRRRLRFEALELRALLTSYFIDLSPLEGALNIGANAYTRDHAVGLDASNESAQPASTATGNETGSGITYDDVTNELAFNFAYGSDSGFSDLIGNFSDAHIHGPGLVQFPATNADAAILISIASSHTAGSSAKTGSFSGTATLSAAQETMLLDNELYINIHSSTFSAGEIRGQLIPMSTDRIGVKQNNQFVQDVNGSGAFEPASDRIDVFGNASGDTAIIGDWNDDGFDEIGVHRGNQFFLDTNANGVWNGVAGGDQLRVFGNAGDVPVIGDWDGDGTDDIGVQRGNVFYLDTNGNGVWNGAGDTSYVFGNVGDTALAGDWDGDGTDEIGVHRGNKFYLDVSGNGAWGAGDSVHTFGNTTDIAIIGDWNADGVDDIGVKRNNQFYLDLDGDGVWDGPMVDRVFSLGNPTDLPIIGKWHPLAP